ncbi:MAG: universal stress protein [Neisseriaceae bacterium]|nr:universal stress protein [Neisseriaceae bacterium]
MYKHLVVAVDGSNTSLLALQHASELAVLLQAKLTLVTVANPTEYMALAPEFLQHGNYEETARVQGQEILDKSLAAARAQGVTELDSHMAISSKGAKDMAQLLVDFANEHGADAIVLGTHGRSGLMHLLMGSFAETVMRLSTLPLLVIRNEQKDAVQDDD